MPCEMDYQSALPRLEVDGNYLEMEDELESDFYNNNSGENTTLCNNRSVTSFKVDENEVSVTRKMGRKYSVMSFKPSECKTKVDIIVTQGQMHTTTTADTDIFDPKLMHEYASGQKIPKPPWPVKFCLIFVFLFVVAMMITMIVVVSMHSTQGHKGIDITVTSAVQPTNKSIVFKAVAEMDNSTSTVYLVLSQVKENGTGA